MRARGFFDVRVSLCLTRLVCCANTNQVHSVETMLSWYKLKIQRAVSPLVLARSMKDDAPLVRNVGNIEKRGRSNISSRCISRILSCQCWSRKWRPVFTWLRSSKRCGELFDEWWTDENHDDATTLGRLGMFTITCARYQHGCAYLIYFSILSIIVTIVTASQERKVLSIKDHTYTLPLGVFHRWDKLLKANNLNPGMVLYWYRFRLCIP